MQRERKSRSGVAEIRRFLPAYWQLARYGAVGLASNAVLYAGYLALTWGGVGHKLAMTILYGAGVLQTFVVNRRWTFQHTGRSGAAFWRYTASYAMGYVLNLAALYVFVDLYGSRHELVQGTMVFVLAGLLFLLQRYWVFAFDGKEQHGR